LARLAGFVLTFAAVVVAWVFFRADSIAQALSILATMADPGHIVLGHSEITKAALIAIYAVAAWCLPNTQQIMRYDHTNRTVGEHFRDVQMRPWFLCASAAVLAFGILGIQQHSEFIYFRF
jgi:hypothetical protein